MSSQVFKHSPSFFVIGAQRAGTTRLCHLLNSHPDIIIPTKEPFYFHTSAAMREKEGWYRALFESAGEALLFGEGSTYYSMCATYPGTAERIARFNPSARIIYMVRHPLRRIESAWYQLLSTREVSGLWSFSEAVLRSNSLIEPTLYWTQLSAYRRCFPDEQIYVAVFEDFVQDEQAVVSGCLRFLGIRNPEVSDIEAGVERNASDSKRQPWLLVDVLKTVPGYQRVKPMIPERLRIALGDLLQTPIRARPQWHADSASYVRARLEDDSHALLDYIRRPHSLWNLDDLDVKADSSDSSA